MNIGGLYNASSLFQSMYNTNSYGSSSMVALTNTMLGGSSSTSGVYSSLSDYSMIKSGGYGKLLSAYYDTVGANEDSKSTSSSDILEKLKASRTTGTDDTEKTVVESEDGKVVEKAETTDKTAKTTATETKEKDVDVLTDLLRRNRTISYTNMGGVIKNMVTPSYDYIV